MSKGIFKEMIIFILLVRLDEACSPGTAVVELVMPDHQAKRVYPPVFSGIIFFKKCNICGCKCMVLS